MAKQIIYSQEAQNKILAGVEKLEKVVTSTLGPAGKNVLIDEFGTIHPTKDGYTVANAVSFEDPFENCGAAAIKEVANKSNSASGDGTTTSTLLAAKIFKNGLKHISFGSNATQVKNGILDAAKYVIEFLKTTSKPITTKEEIKQVCTISANGDEEIGELIADVLDKIGKDGVVKVENGNTANLTSKIVEGLVVDSGYVSPYMVSNPETMESDLDNPFILICDKKISNIQELLPCVQGVSQTGRPLVLIADDFETDIIATIVTNKMRGALNACCIKSPSYGENRKEIIKDIAIATGGQVVSEEAGIKLENATVDSGILGEAKRVLITKDSTIIFDGFGDKEAIDERISTLRNQLEKADNYDKSKIEDRIGKLANGVGIISVGADTEAERKEKRDRVDDAFSAAKSAIKSGIVPGGGVALLKARSELLRWIDSQYENATGKMLDMKVGSTILAESLLAPISQIVINAGESPDLVVATLLENSTEKDFGYDALSRKYCDMIEAGIIDSLDVVVNEVQNASSIASLLLTTEAMIVEKPKEQCCKHN